jgi:hypothetical protein
MKIFDLVRYIQYNKVLSNLVINRHVLVHLLVRYLNLTSKDSYHDFGLLLTHSEGLAQFWHN